MARPSNTEERRRQIVEALMRVMAERGYDQASVAEIAKAAGLAPGLVHYHFDSKQEILLALATELGARLQRRYAHLVGAEATDPLRRVHAFIDAHLALGEGSDSTLVTCWVSIASEATRRADVRGVFEKIVRERLSMLKALVADALRAGDRPARGATEIAAALLAAIDGAYLLGTAAPGALPRGFAAPAVRRIATGLIKEMGIEEERP